MKPSGGKATVDPTFTDALPGSRGIAQKWINVESTSTDDRGAARITVSYTEVGVAWVASMYNAVESDESHLVLSHTLNLVTSQPVDRHRCAREGSAHLDDNFRWSSIHTYRQTEQTGVTCKGAKLSWGRTDAANARHACAFMERGGGLKWRRLTHSLN